MASARETALLALYTLLQGVSGPEVLRNADLPEDVPAGGLVILRDGKTDPEATEETLSPHTYHYQHHAEVEVYSQLGTAEERDEQIDDVQQAIGAAMAANPTLSGAVEWVEIWPPEKVIEPVEGAASITGTVFDAVLHFSTTSPI